MNPALLDAIIKNIVIPEVAGIIRAHREQHGTDPTEAEIVEKLQVDATRYITEGQAFLDRTNGS